MGATMVLIDDLERLWKIEEAAQAAYEALEQFRYAMHIGDVSNELNQTDEYVVTYTEMLRIRKALSDLEISLRKSSEREWVFVEKFSVRRMLEAMRLAPSPKDVVHPAYTEWYDEYWGRVTSDLEAMLDANHVHGNGD